MKPDNKIKSLFAQSTVDAREQYSEKTINDAFAALEQPDSTESATEHPDAWTIITKSKIGKLAVAAVIAIAVMAGLHYYAGPGGVTSVAWADVVKNIEQVQTSIARTTTRTEGLSYVKGGALQETQGFAYYSADYGMRIDKYENGKILAITHWMPAENAIVSIYPQAETYSLRFFTEEEFRNKFRKREPRELIKHIMSFEYTRLGRKTINSVEVEGIEVRDPKVMLEGLFESVVVRLWVGVETNLPVRIEMKGAASNGSVKCEQVVDVVELDGEVDASVFEPNIPGDYKLFSEAEINGKDEGLAVQGLRIFAEITEGRYPSSLAIVTAVNELWKARDGQKLSREEVERGITIQSTCSFYAALDQADTDVAYYGDKVTAEDVNQVLMRWKISDGEYRVIFGDLTTENVGAERLVELEKPASP